MTIINKRLINYILIDKRLNEHFGQISIDFWSLEITEIKFEIRNQLEIKLISKSRTRFQQVSDPSVRLLVLSNLALVVLWLLACSAKDFYARQAVCWVGDSLMCPTPFLLFFHLCATLDAATTWRVLTGYAVVAPFAVGQGSLGLTHSFIDERSCPDV